MAAGGASYAAGSSWSILRALLLLISAAPRADSRDPTTLAAGDSRASCASGHNQAGDNVQQPCVHYPCAGGSSQQECWFPALVRPQVLPTETHVTHYPCKAAVL